MAPKFKFTAPQLIAKRRTAQEDIDEVRLWLNTQKYPKLSDEQICLFLVSRGPDIEEVKRCIDLYYKVRRGPLFEKFDMSLEENISALNVCDFAILPTRTPDGAAIIAHRLRDFQHSHYNIEPSMRCLFAVTELLLIDEPPNGFIWLFDMTGMGLMHLTRAKISAIKTFFQYAQDAIPFDIKAVHVLNSLYFVDKIMAIIKPFLSEKIKKRITFYQPDMKMEEFYEKCIPQECLPSDYGGKLPSIQELHDTTLEQLKDNIQFFKDEEEQRNSIKD